MKHNDRKLAELILYISKACERADKFGAIKLNKILFYADFIAYGRYGESISGQDYQRLREGPAPKRLLPVRNALRDSDELAIQNRERYGRVEKRTIALREPDLTHFTADQIAIVDEVIRAFWDSNAAEVSALSHRFPGWKLAEDGEEIPYESVFISERPLTQEERDYALTL